MPLIRAAQIDPDTSAVTGIVTCRETSLVQPYVILAQDHPMQSPEGWSLSSQTGDLIYTAPLITDAQVTAERDRRTEAGFVFQGLIYDCNAASRQNISGAATLALSAINQGAVAGDFQWHGAADNFAWLSQSNTATQMDAPTVLAFGAAAAEHVRLHVFAARILKNAAPIPVDYQGDSHWPITAL